jgi:hypothetical protein
VVVVVVVVDALVVAGSAVVIDSTTAVVAMVATAVVVVSAVAAVVSAPSVEVASSVVDASPVASLGAGDLVETASEGSAAESAAESSEPHEAIHIEQHTNPVTATRDRDGPTPRAAAIVRIRSHRPRGIGVDGVIPAHSAATQLTGARIAALPGIVRPCPVAVETSVGDGSVDE